MSDVLGLVLGKLDGVRQQSGYWMARCPAAGHDDTEASLSVAVGTDQPVIFKCFAGCHRDDILDGLGLTIADVSRPREERPDSWTPAGPAIETYLYTDPAGKVLFGVCRTAAPKNFRQWRPDPSRPSGRAWSVQGVRLVPYRLPRVLAAVDAGEPVYIAEGEKDVDALETAGVTATCNAGGAGKWRDSYSKALAGATVVIVADNDKPGMDHARAVAASLEGVAGSVRVVRALKGKDASDHIGAGLGIEDFADVDLTEPAATTPPAAMESATSATTVIPWDGNLAGLLDDIHAFLGRFVAYPSRHARIAHTLWIAHTHQMDAWESTPRIAFLSPEPGSGKTRALEVTELLVPRPVEAVNTTPAYLFRKVSSPGGLPTILYDEIDTLFGPKAKDNEEIRGMLNAGHRRGAVAGRCVTRGEIVVTEELPAYCAVALAGLGGLPDTLLTRAVVVRMKRRAPGEKVEPFRRRVHKQAGHALYDRLAAWAEATQLGGIWPEMPAGIEDRPADVWEALLMVADAAEGDWPKLAREAAVALVADAKAATPSLGIRLLSDLQKVWDGTDGMHTDRILSALNDLEEAPWGDLRGKALDPRKLSRFLSDYEVKPCNVRAEVDGVEKVRKGYTREALHDVWARYLDGSGAGKDTATSATAPVTCDVCGEPMKIYTAGQTAHPACDPPPAVAAESAESAEPADDKGSADNAVSAATRQGRHRADGVSQ